MDLEKYKRLPEGNNGWYFDYNFIKKISDMTNISEFNSGMEEVDCVLRVLCESENINTSEQLKHEALLAIAKDVEGRELLKGFTDWQKKYKDSSHINIFDYNEYLKTL